MTRPTYYASHKKTELLESAIAWLEKGHKVAMLTLMAIEGNAPYPVGTQMLVRDDGEFEGQITGGCAEIALVQQALIAIKSRQNITERYGHNSRFFDIKLPCGSGLDITFDVQTELKTYQSIASQLNSRKSVTIHEAKTYLPTPRLLIFGQGPIINSLIELASCSGFDVLLFDHQQHYELSLYCDAYTGLVSLFHEHEYEIDILASAVTQPLFYIGALGSKVTHSARLEKLRKNGVDAEKMKKIHGPIGINIHSHTPAQIAVSIIAQVILVMNQNAH